MAKLIWRLKLVAELGSGPVSEVEVARIERDDMATAETIGLTLEEGKRLTAAAQVEIVRGQVAGLGRRSRRCEHCGTALSSKGHYPTTFRSVFGDVPVRIRRMCTCPCQADTLEPSSFAVLAVGGVTPELAYVTARFAALAPFARVADLLCELLPIGGAANPGTVRNHTMRVGTRMAKRLPVAARMSGADAVPPVIVGLDGGYVRSRHRRPERNFEIVAGKVISSDGSQRRFALARNSPGAEPLAGALARIGISDRTPATVLSDGDAGLRNLQRHVLPDASVVLDWFHIAMRFDHALRAAAGLGAGTLDAWLGKRRHRDLERAKWRLWHGRWKGCLIKLVEVRRWLGSGSIRHIAGVRSLQGHLEDLLSYLEANQSALVNYGARRRRGEPISTAFVESAVNEIIAKRMVKKQQMRWNRWTVQPFLDVRVAVLDGTLERSFRQIYPNFRPANDVDLVSAAV